jgi:anti-anti-sigma factor
LDVAIARQSECVVAAVQGEIDLYTKATLDRRLSEALRRVDPPHALIVDLTPVSFMGSSGLAALLDASNAAALRGIPLHVVAPHRIVRRPVEAAGLERVLSLQDTVEDALAQPRSQPVAHRMYTPAPRAG